MLKGEFETGRNESFGPIIDVMASKTAEETCDVKFRLPEGVRSSQVKNLQVTYFLLGLDFLFKNPPVSELVTYFRGAQATVLLLFSESAQATVVDCECRKSDF